MTEVKLDWHAYPYMGIRGPRPGTVYRAEPRPGYQYSVIKEYARNRHRHRLKSTVWRLYLGGKALGNPFGMAWLAKAYAAEYERRSQIEDLRERRRALSDLIKNGGQWCYEQEEARRREKRGW